MVPEVSNHRTCPAVLSIECKRRELKSVESTGGEEGDGEGDPNMECSPLRLVGGFTQFAALAKEKHSFDSSRCDAPSRVGSAECQPPPSK